MSAGSKGRLRQRGKRRTTVKYSLHVGNLIKYSEVRDELFEGLDVVDPGREPQSMWVRWARRAPWLTSIALAISRWIFSCPLPHSWH